MYEEGYKFGHFLLFTKRKKLLVGKKAANEKIKQEITEAYKIMLVFLSEDLIE